jgi:glycine cleavage system regulatory protein
MQTSLVMTVIGPDRPGLVGRLSAVIAERGGNWVESRMAHLGGQFAGILRIEIPAERQQDLMAALRSLDAEGLTVSAQPDQAKPRPAAGRLATVEAVGNDRPGIVRQISQVLAQHQVNVEELTTSCESAAMSGSPLFRATARVQLPDACGIAQLQQALEEIAADLMVDITIKPGESER